MTDNQSADDRAPILEQITWLHEDNTRLRAELEATVGNLNDATRKWHAQSGEIDRLRAELNKEVMLNQRFNVMLCEEREEVQRQDRYAVSLHDECDRLHKELRAAEAMYMREIARLEERCADYRARISDATTQLELHKTSDHPELVQAIQEAFLRDRLT